MSFFKNWWLVGLLLCAFLLSSCSGALLLMAARQIHAASDKASAVSATAAPAVTHITVDGSGEDWSGRAWLQADPAGDAEEGFLDLTRASAFVNRDALYLLIETAQPQGALVQFDLEFQAGPRRLLISWAPGQPEGFVADVTGEYRPVGPASASTFALGASLEGRVALSDLGNHETAVLAQVRVMVGECCNYPAWRSADTWDADATPVVDEIDPLRLTSSEPRYALARRFQLPQDYIAERLFAPPAPDLTGIAASADGTLFLQHGGLSAGISILDLTSGKVTRILDLPPAGAGYSSIFGGPASSAFVPVGEALWHVQSDGTIEVWGRQTDGLAEAITEDGRMLGVSHDRTRILELLPGGSSIELASGFKNIYDVVVDAEDVLYVSDAETGNITRLDPDGKQRVLASDVLYRDPMDLAISLDGRLFLNSVVTGFVEINLENGAFTHLVSAHSPCSPHPADFAFAGMDRVIFIDPTWSVVTWADLDKRTNGMLASNQGANTWAATIGPDDRLVVGAWGCGDDPAQIVRISDDGTREVVAQGAWCAVDDIAFDAEGGLYFATHIFERGSPVYYLPPGSEQTIKVPGVEGLSSLTAVGQGSRILGSPGGSDHPQRSSIVEINAQGLVAKHTVMLPKATFDFVIDAARDGALYAYASELERQKTGPLVERWLLRLDLEKGTSDIVYQYDRQGCCVMGNLGVDPAGTIWWLVDPENILFRITPGGKATLFAQNLPIDSAAVAVDSQGDVYITSPSGIYRLYREEY